MASIDEVSAELAVKINTWWGESLDRFIITDIHQHVTDWIDSLLPDVDHDVTWDGDTANITVRYPVDWAKVTVTYLTPPE